MKTSIQISFPSDAVQAFQTYARRRQEHFVVLTLNGAHFTIRRHVVTIGIANRTIVHPREVFWPAVKDNAVAIIVAHNHPSGHVEPSEEDRQVTARLKEAGNVMGIPVLDHLIIGRDRYYSFLENGAL